MEIKIVAQGGKENMKKNPHSSLQTHHPRL